MERTKQQALMFLLGAVLVGGALGFSADRYIAHDKFMSSYGPRSRFYDALGLNDKQRQTMDSLSFLQDCAMRALFKPEKAAADSIRTSFKTQVRQILTSDQLVKLDQRDKESQARRDAAQAKEPKRTCSAPNN
jgi:Spy/CpxP family protein refolding chaperone